MLRRDNSQPPTAAVALDSLIVLWCFNLPEPLQVLVGGLVGLALWQIGQWRRKLIPALPRSCDLRSRIFLDRLQLFFDGIPPATTREQLKSSGWNGSPSTKAWQRKITNAAEYALTRFLAGQVMEREPEAEHLR